jgi:hypothetical protein
MLKQNINYGGKTQNSTSYVKTFDLTSYTFNTNFRGQGTPFSFVKTINPSKLNGSFVKTYNSYYNSFNSNS